MKIGIRMPGAIDRAPIGEIAPWAADNGFEAIDISWPDAAAVSAIRGAGLEVGTFDVRTASGLLSPDPAARADAIAKSRESVARARDLGLTKAFTVFMPPDSAQWRSVSFTHWSESWPELSGILAEAGIEIVVEGYPGGGPHYSALGVTPETVRAMLRVDAEHGAGALKLNYDPSHLVRLGIDPYRFLSEFGAHVRHAHGKDTAFDEERLYQTGRLGASLPAGAPGSAATGAPGFGEGWWRYCVPGDGVINWARVAAGLTEAGFNGIVSIELEDFRYNRDLESEKVGLLRSRDALIRHVY